MGELNYSKIADWMLARLKLFGKEEKDVGVSEIRLTNQDANNHSMHKFFRQNSPAQPVLM